MKETVEQLHTVKIFCFKIYIYMLYNT